ncbi:MAG: type II toxin-antitoxin system RelE/ParE family toxin [Bacteroidota bacterium]
MSRGVPIYQAELYSELDERTKLKIVNYIDFLSKSTFPVTNTTISKKLKGCNNLYEILPKPVRLFFFMLGNDAIITHGYVKKKNKTDKTEIERAKSLKARFFKEEDDDGSIH